MIFGITTVTEQEFVMHDRWFEDIQDGNTHKMVISFHPPDKLNVKTEADWKNYLTTYGLLAVLFTLETLERDGFFEECGMITKTIKDLASFLQRPLPTKISPEAIELCVNNWRADGSDKTPEEIENLYSLFSITILDELGYISEANKVL